MTRSNSSPPGAILTLEELKDIVLLQLDVWEWDVDMLTITKLQIRSIAQGKEGLIIKPREYYVRWYGIPDPSYTAKTVVSDGGYGMYLFNTKEEVQAVHDKAWDDRHKSRGLFK